MAGFHGKSGTVSFSGTSIENVVSWTSDITADVVEMTDMQDTFKTYAVGFKDWSATVDCYLASGGADPSIATDLGASAALVLDTQTGLALTGDAICTGIGFSMSHDGIATVSYSFQGNGSVSEG